MNNLNSISKFINENKVKILNYYQFEKRDKIKIILKICLIFVFIIHFFFCIFQTIKNEKNYYERRIKNFRNYNETNLITFEDKINWLIIHDTNRLKAKCADKIKLHDYSKQKLGKDICNKILKIYKKAEKINLNELPEQFVLKTNHGSGFNIIVEDKKKLNIEESIRTLNHWIKIDYGSIFEFHYSFIKRKIFAEEFIGNNLKNYKFLCYSGRPKYVYVSIKDNGTKYRNFYDMKWNFINFSCLSEPHPTYKFNKPKFFELMKYYARKLSSDFKFVRVDLYELEREVRLGELTFAPMNSQFYCKNKMHEIELGKDIETKKTFYDYYISFLGEIGYYN